ncbi:uncharacterized protein LOC108465431 [Gossypium arboreum]|uniref:uncharacterized protein LOC108465431 n=1 Tax=Gossypium arboreum TaxID=29729 RepID=UPI000819130A|nr:uncharacterized protein LOC108465431 [Gossypium arboreum]
MANGEVLEDGTILRSVTSKFNYVVCSIEESWDTSILTIVELQSSLLVHEQRMRSHDDEEHALKITHGDCSSGWTRGCGGFKGKGRGREITNREDTWFLDSGCSNHMCGKEEYFLDFDENFKDTVKLSNNTSIVVIERGNVRLQVDGMVQVITGVSMCQN